MRVNIIVIPPDIPWIAGRLARELAKRLPQHDIDAIINGSKCDLEYHQIVYGEPGNHPAVGLFAHGKDRPVRFGSKYDGQICMNPAMYQYLLEGEASRPIVIEQPVGDEFISSRPIIFGVSGRIYADGRKGEHLVKEMVNAGYTVKAWGDGWPCESVGNNVAYLPAFYRSLDYYVDTSSDEGGCTPALECMAMGIPVISHTLGVDRPVLAYDTHDWISLNRVLYKLTHPRTYEDWAREHAAYFKSVLTRMEKT